MTDFHALLGARRVAVYNKRPVTPDQFSVANRTRLRALEVARSDDAAAMAAFMSGERQRGIFRSIVAQLPLIGIDTTPAQEPRLRLEVLPDLMLSAFATPPDASGATLIVYSQGLSMLLYGAMRSLTTVFVKRGEPGDRAADPEDLAAWAAHQLDWATSLAERPGQPEFPHTPRQLEAAADFATAAEAFVLAHELAHVLEGHYSDAYRTGVTIAGVPKPTLEYPHAREFDADISAMRYLIPLSSQTLWPFEELYAGVVFFFHIHSLMEDFAGKSDTTSHPPASERLALIQQVVENEWQLTHDDPTRPSREIFNLGYQVDRMMTDLRPRILRRSPNAQTETGETRASRVRRVFRAALDGAVRTENESNFVSTSLDLLKESPSGFLDAVRDEYAEASPNSTQHALLDQLRAELGADIAAALDGLNVAL